MTLPLQARIRDVDPRDRHQNEPEAIATDDKVRLIETLASACPNRGEATSLLRDGVVPQLPATATALRRIQAPDEAGVSGNDATEHLVTMLHAMGIETGVDLPRPLDVSRSPSAILRRPLTTRTPMADPIRLHA